MFPDTFQQAPGVAVHGPGVRALAPAKVNLYLQVTGRRPNGYHELDSLMVFADVGDIVEASPAEDLSLSVGGPMACRLGRELPDPDDNIMLRAARRLAELMGVAAKARLHLTKVLPVAAGIGGGSADAAATLKALATLWGDPDAADSPEVADLALALGADVPVCLAGRAMAVSGIGETLTPAVALPEAWLLLVNPGVGVSTPAVFKARQGDFSRAAPLTTPPADASALGAALKSRRNDLEAPARQLAPVIGQVLDGLAATAHCRLARMSGSGATCFGLYDSPDTAHAAADALARAHPEWWLAPAPLRRG
ncbi:4-(cytidine 5'-diphospho)-2-C-methyl-D-erythritol kinase [Roseospirillum parvum]|uniref:4-diphosphocytidyl-2-C-methyl-D-erythritol kinase n=1 Tax=Roseospirillum parvum TaxID=83401 RepID=A0A1G7W4V1_9PROT|nr:4-(cytidine 5'-diphospho)-2-C-methyl-D-erythritol kinase [Roseospirillum parvum]SDG67016.1 4-diphosphocytidyl-2-C-methyl-D-erythritol kinase [Roseospirillum parvum]